MAVSAQEVHYNPNLEFSCKGNAFLCIRQIKIIKIAHLYSFF